MKDWKIFRGNGPPHDEIVNLPDPPPWRFAKPSAKVLPARGKDKSERLRAEPFQPTKAMVLAVNAALYLRRPLLLTGKPGSGKSTLISKVAYELQLGKVIRWPINSRSNVKSGVYDYDAVGRLQAGTKEPPPEEEYLRLGPLGTALAARGRPCALLIDEVDKSDLDFANDLLDVIEQGEYQIPELRRLVRPATVFDVFGRKVNVLDGLLRSDHFPVVIMTSNSEREFPGPFLRRCVRLDVPFPDRPLVESIIESQLQVAGDQVRQGKIREIVDQFLEISASGDVSTDQLLNAIFLTATMPDRTRRTFLDEELRELRSALMRQISGPLA